MILFRDAWAFLTDPANWRGPDGFWALALQQLLITVTALAIAAVIALPIALWLGHKGRGGFLAINVSNIGRAIPTFALLGILVTADWPGTIELGPYGRAGLATLLALALFALPPLITNAYVAITEVSPEVKQAARGMGMTGWQQFLRVELPLAMPLVVGGLRLALVQVWATATLAALVAGPGLGNVITAGFHGNKYGQGIAGAVVVAIGALLLEGLSVLAQRAANPVPDRPRGGEVAETVSAA